MKDLIRRWTIFRLRFRLGMIEAQGLHAEALILDHKARYEALCNEHGKIVRRIQSLQSPSVLIEEAT